MAEVNVHILTRILDNLTGCLEFLQRHLALVWEDQNVPVLITHSGNFKWVFEVYDAWTSGRTSPLEDEICICKTAASAQLSGVVTAGST
jgi:hypothetical protein